MKHRHPATPLPFLIFLAAVAVAAIELTSRTSAAYDAYFSQAKEAFLARVSQDVSVGTKNEGVLYARPGRERGLVSIPGGLVHHWVGAAFIPRATLQNAVDVANAYAAYTGIYKEVIASTLVGRDGDTYQVLIRVREGEAGISAVLDIHSTVQYFHPSDRIVYSVSDSDQVREVKNAGQSNERRLPAGRDSGYLWRASTFTVFIEHQAGVYVEMETLGLSRRFPAVLGWFIEPIARRLGRRSIEHSLQQFMAAMRKADGRSAASRPIAATRSPHRAGPLRS